jgi:hypothetical protein
MILISLEIKHPNAKKDRKIIVRRFANNILKRFSIETANDNILEVGSALTLKQEPKRSSSLLE